MGIKHFVKRLFPKLIAKHTPIPEIDVKPELEIIEPPEPREPPFPDDQQIPIWDHVMKD